MKRLTRVISCLFITIFMLSCSEDNISITDKIDASSKIYHTNSEFDKAREIYNEILKLDASDEWAKENLSRLPDE